MKKKLLSIFLAAVLTCSLFSAVCVTVAAEENAVSVQTNTYFTIKNLGSGKMLNVRGNGSQSNTNVTVYEEDYTTGQNFQFLSNGSGGYVLEAQCAPACALNVYGSSSAAGANVNIWTKTGHSTQAWVVEYSAISGGYIIRSANDTNFVLAASGSANTSNVCIQQYDPENRYQVWTSDAFSIGKAPDPSVGKTAAEITDQIVSTYSAAKSMNGGAKFYGWCGVYIVYQLRALNISSSSDTDITGNGNQMYGCIKAGTTSTGYTKTKYAGNNCLNNIVNTYSGQNVYNIAVSWPHQYGYTDKNLGAGHVTFIHAIIDGTVYYSESYTSGGKVEGTPLSCSLENFCKNYNASYGSAIGAVHFTK